MKRKRNASTYAEAEKKRLEIKQNLTMGMAILSLIFSSLALVIRLIKLI